MADIIVDAMTRVYYVPTIANIAAPTVAELNAGTMLTTTLIPAGLEGFENSTAEVDNTSLASDFDTKLPGRKSFSGTGLVLKKQDGTDTIFNLLSVPNTNGYIVIRDGVATATAWTIADKVEVHPIRTATHVMIGRGEANSLLRYRIPTPITSQPNLKAVVA
jgi:hypothetical protein